MRTELDFAAVMAKLRWLKLPGMARSLEGLLERAREENLTPLEIVDALCEEEKNSRIKSAIERRIRGARFAEITTVDGFDFDWDPGRKKIRACYLALHDLTFLDRAVCPILVGTPGTGKTFLARALAYKACQATRSVLFTTAARMLNELVGAEIHGQITRALRKYTHPALRAIFSPPPRRYADLTEPPTRHQTASRPDTFGLANRPFCGFTFLLQ